MPQGEIRVQTSVDGKRRGDIVLGVFVSLVFLSQLLTVLNGGGPYWRICFPAVHFGPYFWPVMGLGTACWLVSRCRDGRQRLSLLRIALAVLLLAFSVDTLTGGDYRWFEFAMRREMDKAGGPASLQAWAEGVLASPEELESLKLPDDLPPHVRSFANATCSFYRPLVSGRRDGEQWFLFYEGRDEAWGVMIGKSDLVDPSPIVFEDGRLVGWIKKLHPGVYLFVR